jgi:hypothetical protein
MIMIQIILLLINLLYPDNIIVRTSETGNFQNAVSLTSDGKGNIYILDSEASEVIKYNDSLKVVKKTGKQGWKNGEFDNPTSIDGSSGMEIYVSDGRNFRLQRFDLNLSYITTIMTNYEGFQAKFRFQEPVATVYINPYFYVIDGENNRIVAYSAISQSSGTPVFAFGGFQSAQRPMVNPVKIVKDGLNNIYIYDKGEGVVFKYDNFGNYISTIDNITILSVSSLNNNMYILTDQEILVYDGKTNSFKDKILFSEKIVPGKVKDFLVFSATKFYLLEKNKVVEYTLK